MRFINLKSRPGFILFLFVLLGASCKREVRKLQSPPHYNFATPLVHKLDMKLKEISGITWDPKADDFIAVNDESGSLFFLGRDSLALPPLEYSFGSRGDYEDVALVNGIPYVLRSDGLITKFVRNEDRKVYGVEAAKMIISGTNDFETMYYDSARKALVVMCKNCNLDDNKTVSAFALFPDSIGFDNKPIFQIDAEKIAKLSPYKNAKFQPSAAAIHPILQKLFILSAASHQLVITDLSGNVEAVYQLARKLFNQPEGITFKQNGTMFISNEGIGGKATVLEFAYTDNMETKEQLASIGYDFSKPDERMELSEKLHEISGMGYIPGKDKIVAHNDEKGEIFLVDFKNKSNDFEKVKFSGKSDYEDIVHTDSAEYLLISTGGIVKVVTEDSLMIPKEYTLPLEGKNEFETLYKDADGSLVMLCKQCDHEKDKIRSAYRFDPKTDSFSRDPIYEIDITEIQRILGDDKAEFKPSAAGINPVTGKLFVIASVGKLLVVIGKDGKIEDVLRLDPLLYNQPEGMTFAPNGDLYISNEGGEGVARIYKFDYKKK